MTLMGVKRASQSVTIWSAVAMVIVALVGLFGIDLEQEFVLSIVMAVVTIVTGAINIWGRIRATRMIGK